jgi:large subunit ribosomal protein L15
MKLHDLRPADGAHRPRTRVGRGIAAGQGKTAGRGTKGQKARAGGSIPPWFEGGQTPLHMRIPKLRGFKNRFRVEYEVVNVGAIGALAEQGAFETQAPGGKASKAKGAAQITINQDILRAVGLVRTLDKPLKVLGTGDVSMPLFVVADRFSASARSKIEAAGGSVNVLEIPTTKTTALKGKSAAAVATDDEPAATADTEASAEPVEATAEPVEATAEPVEATAEPVEASVEPEETTDTSDADAPEATTTKPAKAAAATKPTKATETKPATKRTAKAEKAPAASISEADIASDEAETTSGDDA